MPAIRHAQENLTGLQVFQGEPDKLLACLLIAERYIRTKGLTKRRLSRKVRLLHHCYAYLRIINETVLLPDIVTDEEHELRSILDAPGPPSEAPLRITKWMVVPDFGLSTVKDLQLGQNDLHLEFPGRWDLTMYPEIFGIPESFVGLVSHITRLGNERDRLLNGTPANDEQTPTMRDFLLRAKLLDKHVCRWEPPSGPHHFMFCAMQKALSVFFYRRVYDVDVTTLQHSVRQVRDLLTQSQTWYTESGQRAVYAVWPAFVTACEALSPDLQEFFQTWFQQGFQQSGLASFRLAGSIVQDVWGNRAQERGKAVHWPDIMRSKKLAMVCM